MAVGGSDNPWWTDLLQYGRSSRYAEFFDVDWEANDPDLRGKVLAPFLGGLTARRWRPGKSAWCRPRPANRSFAISTANSRSIPPITPTSANAGWNCSIPPIQAGAACSTHCWRGSIIASPGGVRQATRSIGGGFSTSTVSRAFASKIPEVFEATHATLFRLYADGLIDGFRVDHVDGLSDPPGYCRRLRQRLDELAPDRRAYLVVEKILGAGESLPTDWGVDGTSGYDFMNEVSAVQHDASSASALGELWHKLTQRAADFEDEEVAARTEILLRGFNAQLLAVTEALHHIARADPKTRDMSAAKIREGLIALLSHFRVYRGYDAGSKRSAMDQAAFDKALAAAKADVASVAASGS